MCSGAAMRKLSSSVKKTRGKRRGHEKLRHRTSALPAHVARPQLLCRGGVNPLFSERCEGITSQRNTEMVPRTSS